MRKIVMSIIVTSIVSMVGCDSKPAPESITKAVTGQKTMKIGTVLNANHSITKSIVKFGEIVEKNTGGTIQIKVSSDSMLGDETKVLDELKNGTVQGTLVSPYAAGTYVQGFNALELPYLFKDKKTAYSILDGKIGTSLLEQLTSNSLIGINFWENGYRHLTNNKIEVKTVEDIKGLNIRTMDSSMHIDLWTGLHAIPKPLAFANVYTAISAGELDGQENPFGNIITGKMYEVQKYLTLTGHVYSPFPFIISKIFWDTLSVKEKDIIKAAAKEARDYQRDLSEKDDIAAIATLKEKGMLISELNQGEKEKMIEELKPLYEKYATKIGSEFVNNLIKESK